MKLQTLRLFKSYLGKQSTNFSKEALEYGLLIPVEAGAEIINHAVQLYGKDGEKWNQTFHKDFNKVKTAPLLQLVLEQIMYYVTTYFFEELGIFSHDTVYIPAEELNIPELDVEKIELINIRPITVEELRDRLMVLLTSGIALSEQTVKDIMVLSEFIDKERFDEISNREVKIALYDKYKIMPKNADEFLRFLIFKLTDSTLKITNRAMINQLKRSNKAKALDMLNAYINKNGIEKLAAIFLRNKRLFLALKSNDTSLAKGLRKELNGLINKLRKLADVNHKPMKRQILDCLTDGNVDIDLDKLPEALDKVTIFREVRILNGVLYRLYGNENIVYRVRNGSAYVTTVEPKTGEYVERLEKIVEVVKAHLLNRLSGLKDKTIYIPSNITYTVPTSEKQFLGNVPQGSYVEMPRIGDMVFGVHWRNLPDARVDLDLKIMNQSQVFGWDANYRDEYANILFSGDITDAPQGATELYYIGKDYGHGAFLVTLNDYTCNKDDVPFEFMVTKTKANSASFRKNHVVNPNDIITKMDMKMTSDAHQRVIGLIAIADNIKLYFNDFSTGSGYGGRFSTSRRDDITMGSYSYLTTYNTIQLKLNDLLKEAGAIVLDTPTYKVIELVDGEKVVKEVAVDVNLSLEEITKETLSELLLT